MIQRKENKRVDLSVDLAVKVIKLCETTKGHDSLVNQLGRAAASIGANIHEADYAHGKSDFIAKLQIALKECYETEYWLERFVKSEFLSRETTGNLYNQHRKGECRMRAYTEMCEETGGIVDYV